METAIHHRPPKGNSQVTNKIRRNAPVKVSLSPAEKEALYEAARKEDRPPSAYLRLLFLRTLPPEPVDLSQ